MTVDEANAIVHRCACTAAVRLVEAAAGGWEDRNALLDQLESEVLWEDVGDDELPDTVTEQDLNRVWRRESEDRANAMLHIANRGRESYVINVVRAAAYYQHNRTAREIVQDACLHDVIPEQVKTLVDTGYPRWMNQNLDRNMRMRSARSLLEYARESLAGMVEL